MSRRLRNRSTRTPLVYTPSRLMQPHGKRERERRLRQIARGSLKVTTEKPNDEPPAEDMPRPGQEETRPLAESQKWYDASDGAADL